MMKKIIKRGKVGNKKRFHKKSLYSKEYNNDVDDDESNILFMGLDTLNDFENEENSETCGEIDFKKEFYYALDERKRLTKKNQTLKEKLSHSNKELKNVITNQKFQLK